MSLLSAACGDGETCNALWDKTISTVSLPSALAQNPFNNPSDPEIIESACYTRLVEPYMAEQYANDEQFWDQYNVSPSWSYFGAHNGLFRKIPATHQGLFVRLTSFGMHTYKLVLTNTVNFINKIRAMWCLRSSQETLVCSGFKRPKRCGVSHRYKWFNERLWSHCNC